MLDVVLLVHKAYRIGWYIARMITPSRRTIFEDNFLDNGESAKGERYVYRKVWSRSLESHDFFCSTWSGTREHNSATRPPGGPPEAKATIVFVEGGDFFFFFFPLSGGWGKIKL